MSEMDALRGRDVLCFSHDWGGDPLSKTHLMRLIARHNRVLWVNSIGYRAPTLCRADVGRAMRKVMAAAGSGLREAERNLWVLNPLVIPMHGRPGVETVNRWWLRGQVMRAMGKLGFADPINFVFNPAAAPIANTLGESALVYYCVDEYTQFKGVEAAGLGRMEEELLRQADLVLVSAERLQASKAAVNPRTVLVRHGVDHAHFARALEEKTVVPAEIAELPRPVLGFFGLLAPWVDVKLLAHVAERFAHGSVVIVGKVETDVSPLEKLPNVHLLGRKPYAELPGYCKGFDVGMIPFEISELTLNANPLKAREYLAAGLPVVSTDLPEVRALAGCEIGRDHDEFVERIERALGYHGSSRTRSESMRGEGWEARLQLVERHLMPILKEPGRRRKLAA